jgi:heat shock protein HslJ
MTRVARWPLLAAALAVPAAAQEVARDFPMDKSYRAVSIGGSDVQNSGIIFKIARDQSGSRLRGSGSAGCNRWTATAVIRDNEIDFAPIATTKMFCGQPRMTTEQAFLASLQSARRWRVEGTQLIIDGAAGRLVLTPDAAR